jgi:hypothetical protein
MLPVFCLRLACGLAGSLLLLSPAQVNPRFYRTQFLTVLTLTAAGAVFLKTGSAAVWLALSCALLFSFLGALAWSLNSVPGGKVLVVLASLPLILSLVLRARAQNAEEPSAAALDANLAVAGELSSAAVLGVATTAMLMGHSYLIAPSMSLVPLFRLLGALFAAVLARAAIAGLGLCYWGAEHSLRAWNDVTLLLPLRWGLSLLAPVVLGVLAWQSARIRSTQSATGILYVVVIFCFVGELLGQLLLGMTGFIL